MDATKPNLEVVVPFEENLVIDFLALAEKKYGFDVVHPNVRAVADALDADVEGEDAEDKDENDENDDEDLEDKDEKDDNDKDPKADAGALAKPRSKRKIEFRYDMNDPFIDDTEMQWEEQAAATKDGFFVYAGPLVDTIPVPENDKDDKKKTGKRKATKDDGARTPKKKKLVDLAPAGDAKPKSKPRKKAESKDKDSGLGKDGSGKDGSGKDGSGKDGSGKEEPAVPKPKAAPKSKAATDKSKDADKSEEKPKAKPRPRAKPKAADPKTKSASPTAELPAEQSTETPDTKINATTPAVPGISQANTQAAVPAAGEPVPNDGTARGPDESVQQQQSVGDSASQHSSISEVVTEAGASVPGPTGFS